MAASSAAAFESVAFWDARYATDSAVFEWYDEAGTAAAVAAAAAAMPPGGKVLDVGCGTSRLPERLAAAGFAVTAIDASTAAIEACVARPPPPDGAAVPTYRVADANALPFPDAAFDAVVDKGTADAVDCGGGDAAVAVLREAARVVRAGGVVVMVSCRTPDRRLPHFEAAGLTVVSTGEVGGGGGAPCPDAHVYVARARGGE